MLKRIAKHEFILNGAGATPISKEATTLLFGIVGDAAFVTMLQLRYGSSTAA